MNGKLKLGSIRFVLSTFIMGIIIGSSIAIVYAASASSDWREYGPIKGYTYENRARVIYYIPVTQH
jgi:hypothetical protein